MGERKRVGLIGGTFNPPHVGHLMIAEGVRDACGLDEIRFMPNAVPPHKVKAGDADAAQRLRMTELAISGNPHFSVERIEVDAGGISYTSQTMDLLIAREPGTDFSFIIGGDSVDQLGTWFDIDGLIEKVEFIGVSRPGSAGITHYPVRMVDVPQIDLSSTEVRRRLAEGRSVKYLLPETVISFIGKEGLYGCGKAES
ncbi:nicotinate-nucleotide adenylyltransferase [Bhargavaea cecembensis]|uniref:nicotinate-nucleotide adenylyltransferase n=1 Tax=Bhargavaea cecembensis TaxID=394098 RepID=UPI000590A308|nr:nicotinate-nucleotide adenylyltransferase [Bhargavaea cecembensis]